MLGMCAPFVLEADMNRVTTKVIARQRGLTLVEWMDGTKPSRAWVTPDMIAEEPGRSTAIVDHPGRGIPYGVDWSELATTHISPDETERRLYNAGVWTVEDLQRNVNQVRGVLNSIAADWLQTLLANARAYQKEARKDTSYGE